MSEVLKVFFFKRGNHLLLLVFLTDYRYDRLLDIRVLLLSNLDFFLYLSNWWFIVGFFLVYISKCSITPKYPRLGIFDLFRDTENIYLYSSIVIVSY